MPHAVLALYILAFSLGVGVITLSAFSFHRKRIAFYASFSLFFTASTILLLREGISTYDKVTAGALGPAATTVLLCLSILGNGLLAFSLPVFSLQLVSIPATPGRKAVHALLVLAFVLSGSFKDLFPGRWTDIINYLALVGLYVFCSVRILLGLSRIEDAPLRALVRRFLILVAVMFPLALAQVVLKHLPGSPVALREYPYVQITFYLSSIGLLLAYAMRSPAEAIICASRRRRRTSRIPHRKANTCTSRAFRRKPSILSTCCRPGKKRYSISRRIRSASRTWPPGPRII